MVVNNDFIRNVTKVTGQNTVKAPQQVKPPKGKEFAEILKEKTSESKEVKFSKHAQMRLEMRNINLTNSQKTRLEGAVDKAAKKGVNDSLVVMDDIAMVVNVKNRTVITAVNNQDLMDNVFTNIDGAIFT